MKIKEIIHLNLRPEIMKLLEETMVEMLHKVGI